MLTIREFLGSRDCPQSLPVDAAESLSTLYIIREGIRIELEASAEDPLSSEGVHIMLPARTLVTADKNGRRT